MRTTFLFLIVSLLSTLNLSAKDNHPEGYVCYKSESKLLIDGELTAKEWGKVKWSNYFVDIEGDKKLLPTHKTRMKMQWDENYLYFAAEMIEPNIWAKLTKRDAVIFHDNDIEIFIDPQGDNHQYYEFEMNAFNTVWDLLLVKPYRDGGPAIDSWNILGLKSAVKIYGTINNPKDKDKKWTVEVAMPWSVLEECASHNGYPNEGEQWRVNFSRVNWDMKVENGKYVKETNPKTNKPNPEHNWVWSPQGAVAMHQPETWGYVQFTKSKVGSDVAFVKDVDYAFKMALMNYYNLQNKYKQKKGKFAKSLKKLKKKNKGFKLTKNKKQFLIRGEAPSGKTWYINQESKIWSE